MVADDNIICDMLYSMGLLEAAVDVLGCDSTCSLLIFDLKSREEAQLVVAAFHQVDDDHVKTDVIPVFSPASGPTADPGR